MRKILPVIILISFMLGSCGPKPQYKTIEGKRKNKHYNEIQYEKNKWKKQKGKGTFG